MTEQNTALESDVEIQSQVDQELQDEAVAAEEAQDPVEVAAEFLEASAERLRRETENDDSAEANDLYEIVDALRGFTPDGDAIAPKDGETILKNALRNPLVPSLLKVGGGAIRTRIAEAIAGREREKQQRQEAIHRAPVVARKFWQEFVFAVDHLDMTVARDLIEEFNRPIDGVLLIKELEIMINGDDYNVALTLMKDPLTDAMVAAAPKGRKANTLLWALFNRAKGEVQALRSADRKPRKPDVMRPGKTARELAKFGGSREKRDNERRDRQISRLKYAPKSGHKKK